MASKPAGPWEKTLNHSSPTYSGSFFVGQIPVGSSFIKMLGAYPFPNNKQSHYSNQP